jgi:hypothetical protein
MTTSTVLQASAALLPWRCLKRNTDDYGCWRMSCQERPRTTRRWHKTTTELHSSSESNWNDLLVSAADATKRHWDKQPLKRHGLYKHRLARAYFWAPWKKGTPLRKLIASDYCIQIRHQYQIRRMTFLIPYSASKVHYLVPRYVYPSY